MDERPDRERVETLLESLPDSAWSIPDPPASPDPPGAWRPRPWFRRPVPLAGALATAALAAALALTAGLLLGGDDDSPSLGNGPAEPTVLSTTELRGLGPVRGGAGDARVVEAPGGERSVELDVRDLPGSGPGRYYELWLMNPGQFVSLGSFAIGPSGERTVSVPLPVEPGRYRAFDLSLEREDGDPAHGAVSVLRGEI